jgi:hypothetical protein
VLETVVNSNPLIDRPITVSGNALAIHSKNSTLMLSVHKLFRLIYLYDDNMLFDNYNPDKPKALVIQPPTIGLALRNALFKVTPVNGILLFGELAEDNIMKVKKANLFLTFGMYAYLPTLPDPYAVNLSSLKSQFLSYTGVKLVGQTSRIWLWLVCQIRWNGGLDDGDNDDVETSFHFAPLQHQFMELNQIKNPSDITSILQPDLSSQPFVKLFECNKQASNIQSRSKERLSENVSTNISADESIKPMSAIVEPTWGDNQIRWDGRVSDFSSDGVFALLDVSGNADQMGVSFGLFRGERMMLIQTHEALTASENIAEVRAIVPTGFKQIGCYTNTTSTQFYR